MFGMEERVRLPNELLDFIWNYIDDDIDSFSLALSGTVRGFAEFYGGIRNQHGHLIISCKCFFLTPSSWNEFFTTYISPEVITNFTANSCYWLPGDQLCTQIMKMRNLEHLGISDTKVSLLHLAKVLDTCKTITKLNFSYHHLPGIENENNHFATKSVKEAFKKLTSLEISTAVLDARDYVNDPWFFLIKILSWCKDCSELAIEITYTGKDITYEPDASLSPLEMEADRIVREEFLPETDWMKSLRSLTIVNPGKFGNYSKGNVRCRLLDHLLYSMFTSGPIPAFLERLWIYEFYFSLDMLLPIIPSLKAFRGIMFELLYTDAYERFRDLEHFGGLDFFLPLAHLPNLKTAYGYFDYDSGVDEEIVALDREDMLNFIEGHSNLEQLSIYYIYLDLPVPIVHYYVPNIAFKLLKLKRLFCRCQNVMKCMVDEFVVVYPNIETLHLENAGSNDLESRSDIECLSSIRFPRLTSLGLQDFNLQDGSFLPSLIAQSTKLERIYLDGVISETSSFVSNLDTFLGQALKLRDFRLELVSQKRDIADAVSILKSLSSHAPNLQRIAIEWKIETLSADWNCYPLADVIVQLALKLERLSCLSLTFFDIDHSWFEQIRQRMVEEVLPTRPALWFHLGSDFAEASDPSVPAVHYQEMVYTNTFDPLPTF